MICRLAFFFLACLRFVQSQGALQSINKDTSISKNKSVSEQRQITTISNQTSQPFNELQPQIEQDGLVQSKKEDQNNTSCRYQSPIVLQKLNNTLFQNCTQVYIINTTIECDSQTSVLKGFNNLTIQDVNILCFNLMIRIDNITLINTSFERPYFKDDVHLISIDTKRITLGNILAYYHQLLINTYNLQFLNYSTLILSQFILETRYNVDMNHIQMNLTCNTCNRSTEFLIFLNESNLLARVRNNLKRLERSLRENADNITRQRLIGSQEVLNLIGYTNFSAYIYVQQNFSIHHSTINVSQILIVASNFSLLKGSVISADGRGCLQNQGEGPGPAFWSSGLRCQGNGGSNGGYGGIGLIQLDAQPENSEACQSLIDEILKSPNAQSCQILTNTTRFLNNLYPYGYNDQIINQGSGGSLMQRGEKQEPSSGGAILIQAEFRLHLDGTILANGLPGERKLSNEGGLSIPYFTGSGSGGSIKLAYRHLYGSGNITALGGDSADYCAAGEGSGGYINFWNFLSVASNQTSSAFIGHVSVNKGGRFTNNVSNVSASIIAQDGSIDVPWCPPQYQLSKNLTCSPCPNGQFKLTWQGQCQDCLDEPIDYVAYSFCNVQNSHSQLQQFGVFGVYDVTGLILFTLFIIGGYVLRMQYRKREKDNGKLIDFETATQELVVEEKIITQSLIESNTFQLGDLLYHSNRINVLGNNTPTSPWFLHHEPLQDLSSVIDQQEYEKFIYRFNKLAMWFTYERILLNVLCVFYYPLYLMYRNSRKKLKYKNIQSFIQGSPIKFWKFSGDNDYIPRLKITKSDDYTLLYIDIFNYKASDTKYLLLNCPYIIYLSGEGNFFRPFYICESDTFLLSLYFAVNQKKDIQEDQRYNIRENLVQSRSRKRNTKFVHKFIKKFNKISMTLDYGAPSRVFCSNLGALHDYIQKWNDNFFSKHSVQIDLLILQTSLDTFLGSQTITVIEKKDVQKFVRFIREIHHNVNYLRNIDVKFGIFIYNTNQSAEDVDEVLFNQRITFGHDISQSSIQISERNTSEFDPSNLMQQFISKNNVEPVKPTSNVHKKSFSMNKQRITYSTFELQKNWIMRWVDFFRFLLFSHQYTKINKFNITLVIAILIFFDYILYIAIVYQLEAYYQKNKVITYLILIWPGFMFFPISPLVGVLWLTSQSYGILKGFQILNSFVIINQSLAVFYAIFKDHTLVLLSELSLDLLIKILISQTASRVVSMNTKLNKLSQRI